MSYPFPPTEQICIRTVGGFQIGGRIWNVWPLVISASDVSERGTVYRARNTSAKVRQIEAYLGVEIAHQPVGARRFRPAEKRAPWQHVDCAQWPPISLQTYRGEGAAPTRRAEWLLESPMAYASFGSREAENCLAINIYVPVGVAPVGGWPVVYWMHGGGSNYLHSSQHVLRAHRLAAEGVIVVVLEYRLGTLGNWYHPSMVGELGYQGVNFSLTDAIAGLEWVRDHIAAFDGNAAKVTIGGSSAGGNMTLCLFAHPYARTLFKRGYASSPSNNTQTRFTFGPDKYTWGLENWHAVRHASIQAAAPYLRDNLNPNRTLQDAITEKGFLAAVRENMAVEDFLALDGGGRDFSRASIRPWASRRAYTVGTLLISGDDLLEVLVAHTSGSLDADLATGLLGVASGVGRRESGSLTIMNDGITVTYPNNRAAALAHAYDADHELMIGAAQQESSVVGFGSRPFNWERELKGLSGEYWDQWLRGPMVNTAYNGSTVAWNDLELKRQTFNFAYQDGAYRVAKSITEVGGKAWLLYGNYVAQNQQRKLCGHTWDVPYIFGNPHYAVGDGRLTADDVLMSDGMVKMLRNFAHTGNPNTDPGLTDMGLDLFEEPWGQTLDQFDIGRKNWCVMGSVPGRSATGCTPTVANRDGFWAHVFDHVGTRLAAGI